MAPCERGGHEALEGSVEPGGPSSGLYGLQYRATPAAVGRPGPPPRPMFHGLLDFGMGAARPRHHPPSTATEAHRQGVESLIAPSKAHAKGCVTSVRGKEAREFFVTRLRAKTADQVIALLTAGPHVRDELIESEQCRANAAAIGYGWCRCAGTTWYRYLTDMLEPEWLSVREGCEVYRRWWRTEEAFLRPKRLFGFKLEAGDCNGVESHSTPHGGVILC